MNNYIMKWGRSSAGRAPALQAGGQRFDSAYLHHTRKWLSGRASPCQGEGREFESRLPLQYHKSLVNGFLFCKKILKKCLTFGLKSGNINKLSQDGKNHENFIVWKFSQIN